MKKKIALIIILALILVPAAVFTAMSFRQETPGELSGESTEPPTETENLYADTEIVMVVTPENIAELERYTDLQSADLSGSTCYGEILAYAQAHPNVNVTYTVELGGITVGHDTAALDLPAGSFDYDTLLNNLSYLPQMSAISLPATNLTYSQISDLRAAYPGITVSYTVAFLDGELEEGVTDLDLSAMDPARISELAAVVDLLPTLSTLELMDDSGSSTFSMTDVKALMDVCPGIAVNYTFDFYGQTLSTATETVEFQRADIGNEGEALIRQALDIMPNCTYFKLDDCGVDSTVMAALREDYPNTKIVWRIFFGKFNCLTDSEMLRLTNGLKDEHVAELNYCTDVKYMDLGHNEHLTDISFVKNMPNLEIVILSGSIVSDISAFENHQNIEFLELCFCTKLEDISPLANCTNLKYLNVSYTKVSDLSALDSLPMERLNCMHAELTTEAKNHFTSVHPDCLSVFSGKQPYGYGWRYNDRGYTFWDYYANMRVIFDYDNANWYTGKEYRR